MEKIAELLGLTSFLDFRLCVKIKKTMFALHFDDTIENILKVKPKEEPYFYFFKYIFLKSSFELFGLESTKLGLVKEQIIYNIKQRRFLISLVNYQTFIAYLLFFEMQSFCAFQEDALAAIIDLYLPCIPKKIRSQLIEDEEAFIEGVKDKWRSISGSVDEKYHKTYKKVKGWIRWFIDIRRIGYPQGHQSNNKS